MAGAPPNVALDERVSTVGRAGSEARFDRAVLVGLALLSIALPLLVAWSGGALGIPRNDDFSYEGILFHWSRTGSLRFDNWPAMTLVGQLAIARPVVDLLGARVTALQILTTLVGALGACATYLLLCRVAVRRLAVVGVLTTLLGPLWAPLAASFMTDVWAYTAIMVCLLLGSAGLSSDHTRRLVLLLSSAATGLVAVGIRESAFLAPVAVLGVAGWSFAFRRRGRARGPTAESWRNGDGVVLVLIVVGLAVSVGLILGWRASIPFGGQSSLKTVRATIEDPGRIDIWGSAIEPMFKSLFTLGLLTVPATALISVRSLIRRLAHPPAVAAGAVLIAATVSITAWWLGPVGNYVTRELAPSLSFGAPDDRMPSALWTAIAALSAYSCFVLVLCVVSAIDHLIVRERSRNRQPDVAPKKAARDVVTTFSLLSFGLMILSGPFRQPIYDRHLLPLVPFVATFVLLEGGLRRFARERFAVAAYGAVAAFAVLGLVFSTSTALYDGKRWEAASSLVASGVDPLRIDGGLDWVGFHSSEPQRVQQVAVPQDTWWALSYRDFRPCVLIASGDAELGPPYRPKPVRAWVTRLPLGGEMRLRAFERLDCDEVEGARAP
jgi:hypothetical protein